MFIRKPLNHALTTALVAGGLAIAGTASAQSQGLYSADELMDAEVYSNQSAENSIGEVEDVLLDESMKLHSLVIDTGNLLDMGENQYVIEANSFSVETTGGDNKEDVEYRVTVDMTEEEITQQPEYDNDWWTETKAKTSQAWENTKETASSAWESTKAATSDALDSASESLDEAGEEAAQATGEAENNAENMGNDSN